MASTFLDRTIGYFSPTAGVRRAQARAAMQALAYEGAKRGRRTDGWTSWASDADSESQNAGSLLRDRARDLVRNNPYAAAAMEVKEAETIGRGIRAELSAKKAEKAFAAWAETCDFDGESDLYGLQGLAERCRMESGEVLIHMVPVSRSASELKEGIPPFALRVLEPDYLDTSRDSMTVGDDGFTHYGIKYDRRGQVAGYWLHRTHPGGTFGTNRLAPHGTQSDLVPADDVIHLFRRLRPGQRRGVTDFAPVMLRMRNLDDYDDAELMRKKLEACLAAWVTSPQGQSTNPLGTVSTDTEGRIETIYPGMVGYLGLGEDVKMTEPKASGGYAEFKRFSARDIATGVGVPYELMTGDLSQINYSSMRAGLLRFYKRVERDQQHVYVQRMCRPIERRWKSEVEVLPSMPGTSRLEFRWSPPRFDLFDPQKETQADLMAVLAGFEEFGEIVRRRGGSEDDRLEYLAKWQKALRDRGITINSNAEVNAGPTTQRSLAPTSEPPPAEDDTDNEEEAA